MEVSELPQNMNRQDERKESKPGISDAIANNIGQNLTNIGDNIGENIEDNLAESVSDYTESCQSDDECDYPLELCYDEQIAERVRFAKCFYNWWFILILLFIGLVFLMVIIACIVVCFCRVCC